MVKSSIDVPRGVRDGDEDARVGIEARMTRRARGPRGARAQKEARHEAGVNNTCNKTLKRSKSVRDMDGYDDE
jgi:hypothetical protein